ncbi:MAG: hypothetical protein HFH92_10415 [Lachnospiraceae bacterium]|nr:hypothetical protein [uncultured Acetatifactor sp.]MCI8789505.1 hypothetical protein [Lachnospiraceae bacterium]
MKYFLIQEDKRITRRPYLINVYEKMDVRDVCEENAYKLPHRELIFVKGGTIFTDIISDPFLLVSEKIKKVIIMYEPRTPMKELILLDRERAAAETYYLPIFQEVDCLGKRTEYNQACTVLKKIVLRHDKVRNMSIFRIAGTTGHYIIGNLDIVESILKRGCLGINLTEVEIVD